MSSEKIDTRPRPLPASSAEIVSVFERLRLNTSRGLKNEINPLEVTLEKDIIKLAKAAQQQLRILIVDDEGVYRNSLAALVNRSEDFKQHIALSFAINANQALESALQAPCLVILDIDLGKESLNGYEVLKALREQGFWGVVCVHSNRSLPEDYKVAVDAGADAVLPKPMSRTHFLKLILQAAERLHSNKMSAQGAVVTLPSIAVVDDTKIILRSWKLKLSKFATVHIFESPQEFRNYADLNKNFLPNLKCLITDFYFDETVKENGLMFADSLRTQMTRPIFLSSDGEFSDDMTVGRVDKVIGKIPMDWEDLSELIATHDLQKGI